MKSTAGTTRPLFRVAAKDRPTDMAPHRVRVLLLEDSDDDAELIARALRKSGLSHLLRRTVTRDDFAAALGDFAPDVVLVDCIVPGFDGVSAIHLARELRPQTPAVVVTGAVLNETATRLLGEGAVDYVLKDRLARLAPVIVKVSGGAI